MNTKDDILAKLRAGEPFGKIRTEVHSISKLYEVAGQYLDEIEAELRGKRVEISKLEEEKSNLEAEVESLRSEAGSLSEEKRELEEDKTRLNGELSENTVKLDSLEERMCGFRARGFTPEIMERLESMVERGGGALLKQVESVEKYHRAMKDFSCLRKNKACLLKEVRTLKQKKEEAQDSVVSITNRIDELKLHVRPLKDAVDAVVWLLKKGYTVEDIRSLSYGLDFLGVEGDPDLSISRLVAGLKRQKSQAILAEEVTRKRHELAELERAIKDAKMTSTIAQDVTVRSIEEVKNASIQAIQYTTKVANEDLTASCEKFDGLVHASLEDLGVRAKEQIEWNEKQCHVQSEFEKQKVLFEGTLRYGQFMQGFFESDEFLSTVSLPWMLQLSRRLHLWMTMRLPDETALASNLMCQRQPGLTSWQPYNLAVLTEFVCAGLETVSLKESVRLNGAKAGVNLCQG